MVYELSTMNEKNLQKYKNKSTFAPLLQRVLQR